MKRIGTLQPKQLMKIFSPTGNSLIYLLRTSYIRWLTTVCELGPRKPSRWPVSARAKGHISLYHPLSWLYVLFLALVLPLSCFSFHLWELSFYLMESCELLWILFWNNMGCKQRHRHGEYLKITYCASNLYFPNLLCEVHLRLKF